MGESMQVYEPRTTWDEIEYYVQLLAPMAASVVPTVWRAALSALNAGAHAALMYGMKDQRFRMGVARELLIDLPNGRVFGTTGIYPSANMVLLVDQQMTITGLKTFSTGTKFGICHVKQWYMGDVDQIENLTAAPEYYRTVRRTFAALLEQELRARGL